MPLLDGLRVIDLSTDVAGAFGSRFFATYGADVVKVEGPAGNPTRRLVSLKPGNLESSALFAYLNAGKRSVVVDFEDPAQVERLRHLVGTADLVVESSGPQAWAALGIDIPALRRERPALVVCSVTPFGLDGPRAGWHTTALTAFAAGGQMMLCGEPELPPLKTAGSQAYYQAGLHVFSASATALFGARRSGVGDWIDISVQEAQAASLEGFGPAAMLRGSDAERAGNQARAVWGIYQCADGYVGLASMARQTPSVYQCIGHPELIDDPGFANLLLNPENNDLVAALVDEWVSGRTAAQVYEDSQPSRAPFALIPTPRELLEWKPLVDGRILARGRPSGARPAHAPGLALRHRRRPRRMRSRAAPRRAHRRRAGQHCSRSPQTRMPPSRHRARCSTAFAFSTSRRSGPARTPPDSSPTWARTSSTSKGRSSRTPSAPPRGTPPLAATTSPPTSTNTTATSAAWPSIFASHRASTRSGGW